MGPDEEAGSNEAVRRNILDGLWPSFFFTGDLETLAAFLRVGPEREVWGQGDPPQELWEDFVRTGDRFQLAEFIIAGGEIDKYERRKTIREVVAAKPAKNPGGSKDAINISFYIEVELRRLRHRPRGSSDETETLTLQEKLASLEGTTKETAIREIASEGAAKGTVVSYEGGRTRYSAGKKLFEEKFGGGWN